MAPMHVVIADDSVRYRTVLHHLLDTIPGVSVIAEAGNGEAALRVVREMLPDLLTLDLHMPQLSGWGVLHDLQANGDGVQVLVLTGYADEHSRQRALQLGATAFVPKGDAGLLIDTLHHLMQD